MKPCHNAKCLTRESNKAACSVCKVNGGTLIPKLSTGRVTANPVQSRDDIRPGVVRAVWG